MNTRYDEYNHPGRRRDQVKPSSDGFRRRKEDHDAADSAMVSVNNNSVTIEYVGTMHVHLIPDEHVLSQLQSVLEKNLELTGEPSDN